ncbi:sensor domain-containing protein [Nakamurella endophytica]|uniref:EAL domain-containing protein n=1 Tax=Nakamurella endophytica TaxID=1748367 RepID=A0A917WI52_9ACTN|nr:GGDEF and EAL domain-containing protein [Nakamurella endophytica]GGM05903.1 hypothetical protein GCM10011594_27670 [Nakamurella endophytica]
MTPLAPVSVPSAAAYEQLFQQAPCAYLLTGDDGRIGWVNETFLRWTGYERSEVIGTPLPKLFPIGDQILYSTHGQPLLAMVGAVAEVAVEVVGRDGARRPALLSAARTAATDDLPATVRVIIFSAHERRRYERELLAARRAAERSESQRVDAEADLHHLALHDSLTGLLNRAALTGYLQAQFDGSGPLRPGLALAFIDLDHFKSVNDSLGHRAGDELLLTVADRLRGAVRGTAVTARLSGDEFVVVDAVTEPARIGEFAQRLLSVLNEPVLIDGVEVVPSASIGIAFAGQDTRTPERLLRHADIAMYRAKVSGRNSWQVHPQHNDPAADRLRRVGELRHGIERGELVLHYQPRIELDGGAVHSAEALVRWQHPTRGLLSPGEFIELAEDSGLVRELGAWVLEAAVAEAAGWQPVAGRRLGVAVNLSPRQLGDRNMVRLVTDALQRHRLDPSLLTLEITETALMLDPDAALRSLQALARLGVVLAVDDFGTGYSSLTYLKRFPIDELKIDQSFVAGLGVSDGDEAIVASCVQLAHAIGIHAVAEGVETDAQRASLAALGCDLAQGYLYSRPVPVDEFLRWCAAQG